jgi:hypothetical protein
MIPLSPAQIECADRPGTVMIELSARYPIAGQLIEAFTRSKYDHVFLVTCDGRLYGAAPPLVGFHPDLPALFRRRLIVRADPGKVWAWALAQRGKPYDLLGNLGYVLGTSYGQPGAWKCSTFVVDALRAGGADLAPGTGAGRVSPGRIARSPLLEPDPPPLRRRYTTTVRYAAPTSLPREAGGGEAAAGL